MAANNVRQALKSAIDSERTSSRGDIGKYRAAPSLHCRWIFSQLRETFMRRQDAAKIISAPVCTVAMPPKADTRCTATHVRYGPKTGREQMQQNKLFDHPSAVASSVDGIDMPSALTPGFLPYTAQSPYDYQ